MKFKREITMEYTETFIPPRCRKERREEREAEVEIEITATTSDKAPVALIVKEFDREAVEVRLFRGKLYRRCQDRSPLAGSDRSIEREPLWINISTVRMLERYLDWRFGYTNRYNSFDENYSKLKEIASKFLFIDGYLYEHTYEPFYTWRCFGLGGNHGGTGFFVEWSTTNDYWSSLYGWSARDRQKAIDGVIEVALNRGDTNDVPRFQTETSYDIKVLMPEVLKHKRFYNPQNPEKKKKRVA